MTSHTTGYLDRTADISVLDSSVSIGPVPPASTSRYEVEGEEDKEVYSTSSPSPPYQQLRIEGSIKHTTLYYKQATSLSAY
jgi:hypothetical protein